MKQQPLPPISPKAVAVTGFRQAELIDWNIDQSELSADEVAGKTLMTLVSPGTEINWFFDRQQNQPQVGGYAAVFEVQSIGNQVTDLTPGQHVFCMGPHMSHQRQKRRDVIPVPANLPVEKALFARLLGVSWTTLTTTAIRPPDRVLILGLGAVGNMAAQLFQSAGYVITGVDPSETRREIARQSGLADVRPQTAGEKDLQNQISLAIDCSGHEQAVVDACRLVRKGGEVVLVGVPWKKRSDATAFDILHAVFHQYVHLRSGWEWELPRQISEFSNGSMYANMAAAMRWIAEKRLTIDRLYDIASPSQAQIVYDRLLAGKGTTLSAVFDWNRIGEEPKQGRK